MAQIVDVAILGAGPYALSLAAHLNARRVSHRIVGEAMQFWRDMPVGLNLKSFAFATNISVPEPGHSYPEWCRRNGLEDHEPCTMESFANYGLEVAQRFVPNIEATLATKITTAGREFEVVLKNNDRLLARRVVVATGLTGLQYVPEILADLGPDRVRHTADITDYSLFRGKRVAVIGGGASAIEAGALVHEAGGSSEIFVRDDTVTIYDRTPKQRSVWERIKNPISVLGVSRKGWMVQQMPLLLHYLPEDKRIRLTEGFMRPASPWWIKDRVLGKVPIHVGHEVISAQDAGGQIQLDVQDDAKRIRSMHVDAVIAGTGFDMNVSRLSFLDTAIVQRISRTKRAPALNSRFESSVPGLHFIGPMSYLGFGPLFKFVTGADATARTLAKLLAR